MAFDVTIYNDSKLMILRSLHQIMLCSVKLAISAKRLCRSCAKPKCRFRSLRRRLGGDRLGWGQMSKRDLQRIRFRLEARLYDKPVLRPLGDTQQTSALRRRNLGSRCARPQRAVRTKSSLRQRASTLGLQLGSHIFVGPN